MHTLDIHKLDDAIRNEIFGCLPTRHVTVDVATGAIAIGQWNGGELRAEYTVAADIYLQHRAIVCSVISDLTTDDSAIEGRAVRRMLRRGAETCAMEIRLDFDANGRRVLTNLQASMTGSLRAALASLGLATMPTDGVDVALRGALRLPAPERRTYRFEEGEPAVLREDMSKLNVERTGSRTFVRVREFNGSETLHEATLLSRYVDLTRLPSIVPFRLEADAAGLCAAFDRCVQRFPELNGRHIGNRFDAAIIVSPPNDPAALAKSKSAVAATLNSADGPRFRYRRAA
jgi:hypothetical protein